jgi:tetratricopeptide (TPR) repeat protein
MIKRHIAGITLAAMGLALMGFASSSFCQTTDRDQALNLFGQERWSDAASAFEALEKQQPGQTDALLYRGKCLVNLKQFKDAGAALQTYLASHPQSDDAMYLLAFVLFRQDKPKESLQLFTEAAKLKTPNLDALKIVSFDYVLLKDYVGAGHYLDIVLQMDPNNLEARYYLGRVRYQQGRLDEAIAAFREVLRRDPGNVKAEDNLGLCLEGKNQVDQAIAAYKKAIALDESSLVHTEQPYLNLGILQDKNNNDREALLLLAKAQKIAPKSAEVRYQLAKSLFSLNRVEDAQREVETALHLNPNDAASHYLLGRIYHTLGKSDLAVQQFKLTDDLLRAAGGGSASVASGDRK